VTPGWHDNGPGQLAHNDEPEPSARPLSFRDHRESVGSPAAGGVQRLLETFMRRGLLIDQLFGALLIGLAITVLLRALPPQSG
jgi:hypothetical protein